MYDRQVLQYGAHLSKFAKERLEGQTIIVNFEEGHYYVLSGLVADCFYLVENRVNRAVWREVFVKNGYPEIDDAAFQTLVEPLLSELLKEKLIYEIDSYLVDDIKLPIDHEFREWKNPMLAKYVNFSELLAIDPIHDTSLGGWPEKLNES